VLIEADKAVSSRMRGRQYRAQAQQSGLSASIPALPDSGRAIADTSRNPKSP
jgi:hypothetical protein